MIANDILLDDDGELQFRNGDLLIGESDGQHIQDILIASPGHYKQTPLLGGSLIMGLNGANTVDFKRDLRLQLESDGYEVATLNFNNDQINIDAERK
jgi:hypothetical protein